MENSASFKLRLAEEISYQGMSNKEFAGKLGISINTLNMYLYRDSIPSADIAVKMAKVLNTTTEYLITGISTNQIQSSSDISWQKKELFSIVNTLQEPHLTNFLLMARAFKNTIETR